MVADTKIQFICSENFNAPALSNSRGSLINVLDVLENGLGLPTLGSASANGSQISLIFSQNHQVKMLQVVELIGFEPEDINGSYRVMGVPNTNTVVIDCQVQNIIKNGSIKLKSFGYKKVFSATNKAVYRCNDETYEHRPFLRVDESLDPVYAESYAKYAKVAAMVNCTEIDDISSLQIPFDSANPTKNWVGAGSGTGAYNGWAKWYFARSSTAYAAGSDTSSPAAGNRSWMIVGDDQAFYLINNLTASTSDNHKMMYGFGVCYQDDASNANPYFLLATWDYATVSTSRDLSLPSLPNTAPLNSNNKPAIIFNHNPESGSNLSALPIHNLYESGKSNDYTNEFVCMPYVLATSKFIVGELPHLRYISKLRTDNAFNTAIYSKNMYVFDFGINSARFAFNLGSV